MVPKTTLAIWMLAVAVQAQYCPYFTCSSALGYNVCANRVADNAYQINANGCDANFSCSSSDVYAWMATSASVATPTYSCLPDGPSYQINPNTWTYAVCYPKQPNRDFKNGQAVVTCSRDIDCQLLDGSHTLCDCVFRTDGLGVCNPDISSQVVYGGYWFECGDNMRINKQYIYNYWSTYMQYYTLLQSDISCLFVFKEVTTVNTLLTAYNSAFQLAIAGLVFLY